MPNKQPWQKGELVRCLICGTTHNLRKITRGDEKVYICAEHYEVATMTLEKKGGYDGMSTL